MTTRPLFDEWLSRRLDERGRAWFETATAEVAAGVDDNRFCTLFSMAARYVGRGALLNPTDAERAAAGAALAGFEPERWTMLETARVALVLAHPHLGEDRGARAVQELFRYADEGELCAAYRSLAHVPDGRRFLWQATEGCRTNMLDVFEAVTCDTPYPFTHFDDVAWRQAVIKALFVGAPLWRFHGLDQRLDAELARMALGLADERRAAGRPVQHELWLALGNQGGERGHAALLAELRPDNGNRLGRRAAAIALVRAGDTDTARSLLATESDAAVAQALRDALDGHTGQATFRHLDPTLQGVN